MKIYKHILIASLYFIPLSKVISQIDTISIERLNLNGNIKQISDFTYLVRDSLGKLVKSDFCSNLKYEEKWKITKDEKNSTETNITYLFDKIKRPISTITYHTPDFPYEITKFKYENNGLISTCDISMNFSDMVIVIKKIYNYNKETLLSGIVRYRNSELFDKTVFTYDKRGNLLEKTVIDNDGTISEKYSFRYDNSNNLIYENIMNTTNKKESTYKYDTLNNLKYTSVLYPDDNFFYESNYEYNNKLLFKKFSLNKFSNGDQQHEISSYEYENGQLIAKIDSATNGAFLVKSTYKYSIDGNCSEIRVDKNSTTEKVYSGAGNLLKHKINQDIYEYSYTFDKMGNWINLVESKNTIPLRIRERKIIYF